MGGYKMAPGIALSHTNREHHLVGISGNVFSNDLGTDLVIFFLREPRVLIQPEFEMRNRIVFEQPCLLDLVNKMDRRNEQKRMSLLFLNQRKNHLIQPMAA